MDRRLSGPPELKPPSEIHLHSEIYKARGDVNAIAHFHHDRTTTFTLVEDCALVAVKNHAIRWASGIPVHDDPSHLNTPERGRAMVRALGPHHAVLIRAHGQIIVSETVPSLLVDCVHFVENAEAMYAAALLGKVRPLSPADVALFEQDLKRDKHAAKLWSYYVGRARARGVLSQDWVL